MAGPKGRGSGGGKRRKQLVDRQKKMTLAKRAVQRKIRPLSPDEIRMRAKLANEFRVFAENLVKLKLPEKQKRELEKWYLKESYAQHADEMAHLALNMVKIEKAYPRTIELIQSVHIATDIKQLLKAKPKVTKPMVDRAITYLLAEARYASINAFIELNIPAHKSWRQLMQKSYEKMEVLLLVRAALKRKGK